MTIERYEPPRCSAYRGETAAVFIYDEFSIDPLPEGGSQVTVRVAATPKRDTRLGRLGLTMAIRVMLPLTTARMRRLIERHSP